MSEDNIIRMDGAPSEEEEDNVVELIDEDGESVQFELLMTVDYNDHVYLALYPLGEDDVEESGVVLLRVEKDENGEDCYVTIEDEDEEDAVFELVNDKFHEDDDEDEADD